MTLPEVLGFKAFADHIQRKPSYVTQLKKDGRLVLTDDGKAVRVAESIALIESTRDPSKIAVSARHAAAREQRADEGETPAAQSTASVAEAEKIGNTYQAARAVKERYLAMAAKRDYEVSVSKLLDASEVRRAVANAATALRQDLESLPDNIAPVLAGETDESRIRILLADEIEHVLTNLAARFGAIANA